MSTPISQPLKKRKNAKPTSKVGAVKAKRVLVKAGESGQLAYARKEYGVTESELKAYSERVHAEIEQARKEGKLREFTGDIEALCEGHGDA